MNQTREAMASGSEALLRMMPSLKAIDPDVVYTQTITNRTGLHIAFTSGP